MEFEASGGVLSQTAVVVRGGWVSVVRVVGCGDARKSATARDGPVGTNQSVPRDVSHLVEWSMKLTRTFYVVVGRVMALGRDDMI